VGIFEEAFPQIDFGSLEPAKNVEDVIENLEALIDLLTQTILDSEIPSIDPV
jgi:hypothetical protein